MFQKNPKAKKIMVSPEYQGIRKHTVYSALGNNSRLVEYILKELSSEEAADNFCFCYNDPTIVLDSSAEREPDVVNPSYGGT